MKRTKPLVLFFALAACTLLGGNATAQTDPTEIGGGKKAYVLLVIDSSASMEFSTVDDNTFATTDLTGDGVPDQHPYTLAGFGAASWKPGDTMNVASGTQYAFGSCFVYHPAAGCGAYNRPSWRPPRYFPGVSTWSLPPVPASSFSNPSFYYPFDHILTRGREIDVDLPLPRAPTILGGWRLQDATQPRHVTIKEILTGDMILLPYDPTVFSASYYDPDKFAPGCWFIPRQRYASSQSVADQEYCLGDATFEQYPDFDQPVPHFQEYYDLQLRNGALDVLSSTALFAVAAFDSFRLDLGSPEVPHPAWDADEWDTGGWTAGALNDHIDGTYPSDASGIRDNFKNEGSSDCDGDATPDDPCYNLGIWRVIGPSDLAVPSTLLPELAAYTQIAINDTGYLTPNSGNDYTLFTDEKKSKANAWMGATFSKRFENYAEDIDIGKQPIARATPLAAAVHDVYQFLSHGQDGVHPHEEDCSGGGVCDPFSACRPKHVMLLTDGTPEPERDPTHPTGVSSTLNQAFGYDSTRYTYDTVEKEIAALVGDTDNTVGPPNGASVEDLNSYNVRVHVMGLNLDTQDDDAVTKMAQMAIEGNSCASALLGESFVPAGVPFGTANNGTALGTCVPNTTGCLIDQSVAVSNYQMGPYSWTHPGTNEVYDCSTFPALILDTNDPTTVNTAVRKFLSELVDSSGLSSRTGVVTAGRLDDTAIAGGGQYRVYSGMRVGGGGGSPWWQGVLNRNTLRCDSGAAPEVSLSGEIGTQVSLAGVPTDSRRIWTSIPDATRWCHTVGGPCTQTGVPVPVSSYASDPVYPFSYDLATSSVDEFEGTYLNIGAPDLVTNTRVPFRHDAIDDAFAGDQYNEFNVIDQVEMAEVINIYRGRIPERVSTSRGGGLPDELGIPQDRTLGGILNSQPVVVGPPNLDLPIASYRNFRARYADRATMMYVSGMEGLLHAIHMGTLAGRVNFRAPTVENGIPVADQAGDANMQREAWAYMPWMVHNEIASFRNAQAYLMDGSPAVKDVRLCGQDSGNNANSQACQAICPGGCTLPGADQWRTTLVQGRGLAGAGYYAMDITRPGGLQADYGSSTFALQNPDPIVLWEFDRAWEQAQVEHMYTSGDPSLRARIEIYNPHTSYFNGGECPTGETSLNQSSLMGLSVSEPEIATVIVNGEQRPVAVFGGGANDPTHSACGGKAAGMAVYIVDLQTGTLLRRFAHYEDDMTNKLPFMRNSDPHRFTGSPVLFDSSTGAIATRGFIGDDGGRLFRIDLLNPDPTQWKMSLFFDPYADTDLDTILTNDGRPVNWGPAGYKPAVALNPQRDVMVVYGLGEVGDVVSNGQAQAVLALTEERANTSVGVISWAEVFPEGEKITGAPIIFNAEVYFPTYAIDINDQCEPGLGRIWGLQLPDPDINDLTTRGIYAGNPTLTGVLTGVAVDTIGWKWFGPEEPTLFRGLTVTLGQLCSANNLSTDPTFSTGDQPKPQLIAQSATQIDNTLTNTDASATPVGFNALDRVVLDIEPPSSQTFPLSWSQIY